MRAFELPFLDRPGVWQVDLRSDRAFHPGRLMDRLERLGAGRHRSKGCFWLPTRPDQAHAWVGAGGQVSIGNSQAWGRRARQTRLVITGTGTAPDHLQVEFDSMLLEPNETYPAGTEDGFEAWLGPIRDIA